MSTLMINILVGLGSTIFGVLLSWVVSIIIERYRFRQELKNNNNINITGEDWFAAWQTSVNQIEIINTEKLSLKQKGMTVKICNLHKALDNPEGGYLWEGQLSFFQGRDLLGWYTAKKEENNTSKGMMYFCYDSPKKLFIGKWIGSAYDGPLNTGFGVISKNIETSKNVLNKLITKHKHDVIILKQEL